MGSKGSKNSTSSTSSAVETSEKPQKTIYEKIMMKGGPKPEEILISELVNTIPKHLCVVNNDKSQFLRFYQDIWLPERLCLLDKLQELHDEDAHMQSMVEITTKVLLLNAACKALVLLFLVFYVKTILCLLITLSLIVDGILVYHYNECKIKKEKIQTLLPILHSDISNTVMLKSYWSKSRKSFRAMQSEVSSFIRDNKNHGYENDDPIVQRFLNNTKIRDAGDSEGLCLFFQRDFLLLICDYNASLKFLNVCKNDAYEEYYNLCNNTMEAIVEFCEDAGLMFKDIDFTDMTQSAMEIISADLNVIGKKIKSALEILKKETAYSDSSTKHAKTNLKKRQ